MSPWLLRCYPPAWRERYGEELAALIVEASGGGRVPWRVRADVALAGGRERLRRAGLAGDGDPREQARAGALVVLCSWSVFVLAGLALAKLSEHWRDAPHTAVPIAAFNGLIAIAVIGGLLVLAGVALAVPALRAFLRAGGWAAIRGRVMAAAAVTALAVAATAGLVVWAHGLSAPARNGHDASYTAAFLGWAALVACALLAWTAVGVATARRLDLTVSTLRGEARAAMAVTVAMALMTVAATVWGVSLTAAAPPYLAVILVVMVVATLAGAGGARRAMAGAYGAPAA